jgi:SAM-dependent methyltransferase
VFETYSKIRPDQVVPHIKAVRAKLWAQRAYPCTGLFIFLVPWIRFHSAFDGVIARMLASPGMKLLDVGCYIGHDLRALYLAGVPQTSLYGLDIVDLLPLGHELFRDVDRFDMTGRFEVGDVLDEGSETQAARKLDGHMDIVWCSAVLHQFPWDKAMRACKRLLRYSVGSGAMIIGAIAGVSENGAAADMQRLSQGRLVGDEPFQHSAESLERLWAEVGRDLALPLRVTTAWKPWSSWGCDEERCSYLGPDFGILEWTVYVLSPGDGTT